MTGRHPWLLGAAANHQCVFPPEVGILPEALEKAGYFYASTGKVWGPGLSLKADDSPRSMSGKVFARRKTAPPAEAIANNDYAANFADLAWPTTNDEVSARLTKVTIAGHSGYSCSYSIATMTSLKTKPKG